MAKRKTNLRGTKTNKEEQITLHKLVDLKRQRKDHYRAINEVEANVEANTGIGARIQFTSNTENAHHYIVKNVGDIAMVITKCKSKDTCTNKIGAVERQKHKNRKNKKQHTKCMSQERENIGNDCEMRNNTNMNESCKQDQLNTDERVADFSNKKFSFQIDKDTWSKIKPEMCQHGWRGRSIRRMKGNWRDMFAEKTNTVHEGCVLAFKAHHVKYQQ